MNQNRIIKTLKKQCKKGSLINNVIYNIKIQNKKCFSKKRKKILRI